MAPPMGYRVPTIDDLRRQADSLGVTPTDADLERVRAFLAVLYPQFDALERLVPPDVIPAAVFRPEVER
jgi:hypothetical protein